jgi:hypothetical protein
VERAKFVMAVTKEEVNVVALDSRARFKIKIYDRQ